MNTDRLKAREIEALTFVYSAPQGVTLGERKRWSKLFNWLRAGLIQNIGRWSNTPMLTMADPIQKSSALRRQEN